MGNRLILPGRGEVLIDKGIQHMSRMALQTLSRMHDVASELGDIEVRCLKCGQSFTGSNNANSPSYVIACGCREIHYVRS